MIQQVQLKDKDQEKILYQFNDTKTDYPTEKIFHELFEEQAAKTPDNFAIIFKEKKLTYRQLNDRSNQLARVLREKGIGKDHIVGLMVEDNSVEVIVGMISILKAGGAFLPIDKEFPNERIEFMIEDSNLSVLLNQGNLNDDVMFNGVQINLEDESIFAGDSSNLDRINQPNDLAYVIYTSGSTGKPKGVQIEHTSIVNQIYGLEQLYDFDVSLRHILLAPVTFDPSVQQIFLPLSSGGELFLVSKSTKQNLKELWEFILHNRIDIVNTVPSLMSVLLDHAESYQNLHFKFIILAGELFSKKLYLRIREILSAEIIINIYGPTEATINTTLYECKLEELSESVPIGKPLMNYTVFILDENQNLSPIGRAGEICISGVGLARGYLNNRELTDNKFVMNPFIPGEKMYRTGDLGRWTDDGNIEFIGRVDHQVKINGKRVELGEIESALCQHATVQESIVINMKSPAGNSRLVAFIVMNKTQKFDINEIQYFLRKKLPDYMIPSSFIKIEFFPITQNGKVDRIALEEIEKNTKQPVDHEIPGNETEEKLVKIWKKVLGVESISVKDNFFEIGGTSLLSMVLFSEVERVFGKNLPLATIIDSPTIVKLAEIVSNEEWSASWSPLVAIQPEGSRAPFFCVHGHRGNVIGFHELARLMGKDQPFYGLQAEGLDGKPLSARTINKMASKYVEEIKTVQPEGPYFIGGWCMGGTLAYEMAQILQSNGEKVAFVAMIETNISENYPKRLPSTKLPHRIYFKIVDRIKYELMILRTFQTKEKLSYFSRKIKNRITTTQIKFEKLFESIFSNSNINLPHSRAYKLDILVDNHEHAILNYKPLPYDGKIALFTASHQPFGIYKDTSLGWSKLMNGKMELYEFPGHHLNVFIEPSLKVLASQLNSCIDDAYKKNQTK